MWKGVNWYLVVGLEPHSAVLQGLDVIVCIFLKRRLNSIRMPERCCHAPKVDTQFVSLSFTFLLSYSLMQIKVRIEPRVPSEIRL